MRKPRKVETDDERDERLKRGARWKAQDEAAADDAVDAKIRQNIKLNGP